MSVATDTPEPGDLPEPADDDVLPGSHPWIYRKTGLSSKGRNREVRAGRLVPFDPKPGQAAGRRGYLFRASAIREWADQHQAHQQKAADQTRRRDAANRGKRKRKKEED